MAGTIKLPSEWTQPDPPAQAEPASPEPGLGWKAAALLTRLIGGVSSGVVGAVPTPVTTPTAGVLGGGAESLAEWMEGSKQDPLRIGTEAALGMLPLGKVLESARPAVSVLKGIAHGEGSNLIRRKEATGHWLPQTTGEAVNDVISTGLGGLSGFAVSRHPNVTGETYQPTPSPSTPPPTNVPFGPQTAGEAADSAISNVSPDLKDSLKTQKGLRIAYDQLRKAPKSAPATPETLAMQQALDTETLKNPGGELAQSMYGPRGRASSGFGKGLKANIGRNPVTGALEEQAPPIAEYEGAHQDALDMLAAEKAKAQAAQTKQGQATNTANQTVVNKLNQQLTPVLRKKSGLVSDLDKGIADAKKIAANNVKAATAEDLKAARAEDAADLQNLRATQGGTDIGTIERGEDKAQAAQIADQAKADREAAAQAIIDRAKEGKDAVTGNPRETYSTTNDQGGKESVTVHYQNPPEDTDTDGGVGNLFYDEPAGPDLPKLGQVFETREAANDAARVSGGKVRTTTKGYQVVPGDYGNYGGVQPPPAASSDDTGGLGLPGDPNAPTTPKPSPTGPKNSGGNKPWRPVPPRTAQVKGVPESANDPEAIFNELATDAMKQGFRGDPDVLRSAFNDKMKDAQDLYTDQISHDLANDPKNLPRRVAALGGIKIDQEGNEAQDMKRVWDATKSKGTVRGVKGVLKQNGNGGKTPDEMVHLLSGDKEFAHIKTPQDLAKALEQAHTADYTPTTLAKAAEGAGLKKGTPWWEAPAEGSDDFAAPTPVEALRQQVVDAHAAAGSPYKDNADFNAWLNQDPNGLRQSDLEDMLGHLNQIKANPADYSDIEAATKAADNAEKLGPQVPPESEPPTFDKDGNRIPDAVQAAERKLVEGTSNTNEEIEAARDRAAERRIAQFERRISGGGRRSTDKAPMYEGVIGERAGDVPFGSDIPKKLNEEDVVIPGLEGARAAENPTPKVADVPFSLTGETAPAAKPVEAGDLLAEAAKPEPPAQGAIPARLYKSPVEAAGAHYESLKGENPEIPGAPRQDQPTRLAGRAAQRVAKEAGQAADTKTAQSLQSDLDALQKDPSLLKKFLKGESGGIDPITALKLASVAGGGLAGYYSDPLGNPYASALAGAAIGGLPLAAEHFPEAARYMAGKQGGINSGLDMLNKAHNTGLLSPLSVVKKAGGDLGGIASAMYENPTKAVDVIKSIMNPETRQIIGNAAKEGWQGVPDENASALENFLQRTPLLSWSGRAMGGLTRGTKALLGESGFTPQEQRYYTLTDYPTYGPTEKFYNAIRSNKVLQHFIPFAKIAVNRLERGYERSPFGLINTLMTADPQEQLKALQLASQGTTATAGAYALTPEGFVRKHPIEASTLAALAGPYGLPVLAGMAAKTAVKDGGDQDFVKSFAEAMKEVSQDTPGLRLIEDFTSNPVGLARNYLSGYTNITRPLALLQDYLTGNENEPDVSSKQLPLYEQLLNRAASNVPVARQMLPIKEEKLAMPKFEKIVMPKF